MSSPQITVAEALRAATDTRCLEIGNDLLSRVPEVFKNQFGFVPAILVTDTNTFGVAGKIIVDAFAGTGHPTQAAIIIDDPNLYAEYRFIDQIESALGKTEAIPIAVGSGTLNDLVKLSSHHLGRPYMCVATAASMDGYTAFGASITKDGSKQTFTCPAPRAVVADLRVIRGAPASMNASGYADLVAKVTAGADWLVADALGAEPIHQTAWTIVQGRLREMISDPAGIPEARPAAIERLVEGLMLAGFAMQSAKSSRAASGAEHQFSHLWDMEHHTHEGQAPSHGFKVGIGTLAVTGLYEYVLRQPIEELDVEACCAAWPSKDFVAARIDKIFHVPEVHKVASTECLAKQVSVAELCQQLTNLKELWPKLKPKLQQQLLPFSEVRDMLRRAGAPCEPEQIGITRERLRESFWKAHALRRRFNILDVAVRTGLLEPALSEIFGPNGRWPLGRRAASVAETVA